MRTYLILIIFFSLFTGACKKQEKQTKTKENSYESYYAVLSDKQLANSSIKLGNYKNVEFTDVIEVSGNIEIPPSSQETITPVFSGIIRDLNLIVGQKVAKGQFLFSIENPELISLQQEFASLSEQLTFLKNDFERQLSLFKENVSTEKKYLKAESDYKSHLANYNGLKKKIQLLGINTSDVLKGDFKSKYKINAPISGYISKIEKLNGSFVSHTDQVAIIVDKSKAHLSLNVYENDIAKIKKGQKVIFKTSDDIHHNATVHLLSPAIDPIAKSLSVHADIDEIVNYSDNTYITAQIITGTSERIALPINSLLHEGEESFILVLEKKVNGQNYFVKYPVKISIKDEINFTCKEMEKLKNKLVIIDGGILLQKEE